MANSRPTWNCFDTKVKLLRVKLTEQRAALFRARLETLNESGLLGDAAKAKILVQSASAVLDEIMANGVSDVLAGIWSNGSSKLACTYGLFNTSSARRKVEHIWAISQKFTQARHIHSVQDFWILNHGPDHSLVVIRMWGIFELEDNIGIRWQCRPYIIPA